MELVSARPHSGRPGAAARGPATRDRFLDTVRAIAVIRVVAWHTFGWAPLTWVVSAVPAMIFVSGHLLAQSFERRPIRAVLGDRLRRLLVPLWVFAAGAWAIMIGARFVRDIPETRLPWRNLPLWIFPINDPKGSLWEGGWLSQPLWYLRVLLLLLLSSPVLIRLARRPALTAGALVAVTVGLEVWQRQAQWHPSWAPDLVFRLGDYTLYAAFFVLGMGSQRRTLHLSRTADWLTAALVCALAAVASALALEPQDWVVNNSHTVHFCVGAAWLSLAFAARPALDRLARLAPSGALITAIGRRSLTIYLWHSGCAITVWHLLVEVAPLPRGVHSTLLGLGTALLTTAVVLVVGVVEDLAAGRATDRRLRASAPARSARWAVRLAGAGLVAACLVRTIPEGTAAELAGSAGPELKPGDAAPGAAASTTTRRPAAPRVPSQAPRRPEFERTTAPTTTRSTDTAVVGPTVPSGPPTPRTVTPIAEPWTPENTPAPDALTAELERAVDRWAETWNIRGVRVAIARPDVFAWKHSYGVDWDEAPLALDGTFDIESITKTFTASIAWQLVADGVLDLNTPLPALATVPEFPADTYPLRYLLEHKSGIPDYHDTAAYAPDGYAPVDRAIASALLAPQLNDPGFAQFYSSTNYLIIGRYLEQVLGQSIESLIDERLLEPNGISSRFTHAPSSDDYPGGGAAGLVGNLDSLLVWGDVLLRLHLPVGDEIFARMATLSESTSLGSGLYGYCPCTYDEFDRPSWQRLGHSGGTTSLQYARDADLLVALQVPAGVWGDNDTPIEFLIEELMAIVANYGF